MYTDKTCSHCSEDNQSDLCDCCNKEDGVLDEKEKTPLVYIGEEPYIRYDGDHVMRPNGTLIYEPSVEIIPREIIHDNNRYPFVGIGSDTPVKEDDVIDEKDKKLIRDYLEHLSKDNNTDEVIDDDDENAIYMEDSSSSDDEDNLIEVDGGELENTEITEDCPLYEEYMKIKSISDKLDSLSLDEDSTDDDCSLLLSDTANLLDKILSGIDAMNK